MQIFRSDLILCLANSTSVNRLSTFGRWIILFCLDWEFDFHSRQWSTYQRGLLAAFRALIILVYFCASWLYLDFEVILSPWHSPLNWAHLIHWSLLYSHCPCTHGLDHRWAEWPRPGHFISFGILSVYGGMELNANDMLHDTVSCTSAASLFENRHHKQLNVVRSLSPFI
jgi:hypothetical protein